MRWIEFNLTMPNKGSWNNKWSQEDDLHAITKKFLNNNSCIKNGTLKYLLDKRNFNYTWNDGWMANVEVSEIDSKKASFIRKHSRGLYGYEWMIESLLKYKEIKVEKGETKNG